MYTPEEYLEGRLLLIDKPKHWTSHDVVNKVRYHLTRYCKLKKIKVGHAGTLDPLATGLLILATGKMTKQLQSLIDAGKTYTGTIKLGVTTPSYDGETPEQDIQSFDHLEADDIRKCIAGFAGEQQQIPPIHSAIKKDGAPLYIKAREGAEIKAEPRNITIYNIHTLSIEKPLVTLEVSCSKGTYIRSLAHDIGRRLGCGAYLHDLQRTVIGQYRLDDAITVETFLRSIGREPAGDFPPKPGDRT